MTTATHRNPAPKAGASDINISLGVDVMPNSPGAQSSGAFWRGEK